MSVKSSRKTINTSILKSGISRDESIKKSKVLRFALDSISVKDILRDLELNPDLKSYQNLVYKLTDSHLEEDELRKIILDSIESISLIDKNHVLLLEALLNIRWISKQQETVESYHKFLFNLLTTKSEFLVLCLSRIFRTFVPSDEEYAQWSDENQPEETEKRLALVHELLKKILETVPMVKLSLKKIIRSEFPYFKQPDYKVTSYIGNLLKILNYSPSLTHDILELIFENILMIDVNVTKDQIDQFEEENSSDSEEEFVDKMKLPIAETLDQCMELMFSYLHGKFYDKKITEENQMIIEAIFDYFDEHVLKTFTKHMHFILFYLSNLSEIFANKFLEFLWKKITNKSQSATMRQTAIGYLASFLSRAKFVDEEIIKNFLNRLSIWAHDYIRLCDHEKNRNPKSHVVFYSMCQAIFYIIAFRSKDLTKKNSNLEFLLKLNLWPLVKHPLNPLHVCIPAIVTVFDNVTSKYQILFCHQIIVNNASKCLTTVYANDQHRPEEILESIFPFDPYLLKKSGKRIGPLYVEYQESDDEEILTDNKVSNINPGKRIRCISTSHDFEDFIINENKKFKQD